MATPTEHGKDCRKVEHQENKGYMHPAEDDSPYEVDGIFYCGRCHAWMELPVPNGSFPPPEREGP